MLFFINIYYMNFILTIALVICIHLLWIHFTEMISSHLYAWRWNTRISNQYDKKSHVYLSVCLCVTTNGSQWYKKSRSQNVNKKEQNIIFYFVMAFGLFQKIIEIK